VSKATITFELIEGKEEEALKRLLELEKSGVISGLTLMVRPDFAGQAQKVVQQSGLKNVVIEVDDDATS
jgi:DNA-binding Lrp family transcriptional regulator